jgi:cytochrome bd-type quinol oxidase subunit 1
MDVLILFWIFDSRWMFNIDFKLHMMWAPISVDLLTMIAYNLEKDIPECPSSAPS